MTRRALSWPAALRSLAVLCLTPAMAAAQSPLTGFGPVAARRQLEAEPALRAAVDTAALRRHTEFLSAAPRVAGTAASIESAGYVLRELAGLGFDTARVAYTVYLPLPESTFVDRVRPQFARLPLRLLLNEIPVPGDSFPESQVWRAMAAYSGGGDVTGPLVFAHLGRAEDYRTLDSLGVRLAGAIALVRLGTGSPAAKVRAAEARGVAGLVLYPDPADDGFAQGDPFPLGAMRPPDGVERVSLLAVPGDPTTPGRPAEAGATRVSPDSAGLPRIPVVPISYRNTMHLLPALAGPSVPQAWQGGLPLRYHVGGDTTAMVRVAVWPERGARAFKTIVNTVATLRGAERPGEVVLAGAHRDAWSRGAADNASGVATLLEAGRAVAALARAGHRPVRTLVLATWDAGEWGQIGSTEFAEQMTLRPSSPLVAYVNHDVTVSGGTFSAAAAPALGPLLVEAAAAVASPVPPAGGERSVLDRWRADDDQRPAPLSVSDFCADCAALARSFHAPALEFGFRQPTGLRHSAYDGPAFMATLGDPGLAAHAAAARLSATLLSRLLGAPAVPIDYVALADDWRRRLGAAGGSNGAAARFEPLARATASFERHAGEWSAGREAALAADRPMPDETRLRATAEAANRAVRALRTGAAPRAIDDAARRVEAAAAAFADARRSLR